MHSTNESLGPFLEEIEHKAKHWKAPIYSKSEACSKLNYWISKLAKLTRDDDRTDFGVFLYQLNQFVDESIKDPPSVKTHNQILDKFLDMSESDVNELLSDTNQIQFVGLKKHGLIFDSIDNRFDYFENMQFDVSFTNEYHVHCHCLRKIDQKDDEWFDEERKGQFVVDDCYTLIHLQPANRKLNFCADCIKTETGMIIGQEFKIGFHWREFTEIPGSKEMFHRSVERLQQKYKGLINVALDDDRKSVTLTIAKVDKLMGFIVKQHSISPFFIVSLVSSIK